MRITRTSVTALAGIAVAAAAGCGGQARVAPRPTVSRPAVSVSACTSAMEKVGEDVLVQAAVGDAKYPAPVTRACDGLSSAAMSSAVNQAMSHLMSAPSGA